MPALLSSDPMHSQQWYPILGGEVGGKAYNWQESPQLPLEFTGQSQDFMLTMFLQRPETEGTKHCLSSQGPNCGRTTQKQALLCEMGLLCSKPHNIQSKSTRSKSTVRKKREALPNMGFKACTSTQCRHLSFYMGKHRRRKGMPASQSFL